MTAHLRIAFAGTPEFALPALTALSAAGHTLAGVWTQPDRPAGRGRKLAASPVKRQALERGWLLHQPASLRDEAARQTIRDAAPEVMVVVAYGLLLPRAVLEIPRYGCLNIHASLLPRWRGAAPIQRALLAGDTETGISIMQMAAGLDTGPVLLTRRTPIGPQDTAQSLHDRLAALGAEAIVATLANLDSLIPAPQDEGQATYAKKLVREEARLDWSRPAHELARCVRAYNPWPVAYTNWQDEPLRIWAASAHEQQTTAAPGSVLETSSEGLRVATGAGVLRITQLQPAGKRIMSATEFSRGRALTGVRFV